MPPSAARSHWRKVALNAITALTFPFVLVPDDGGVLDAARALLVHAISVTATALFVFFAVMAMRGALTATVSARLFDRAAAYVQFALLLLVIAAFFLRPPVRASVELAASGRAWMWPNIWFFGFYEVLLGSGVPVFQVLAGRAAAMFLLSMAGAAVGLYLAYLRRVRHPLDQPETSTARERIGAGNLFRAPRERALLNFTLRALLRSRQHRTLLALYAGAGVSCSLIGLAHVIYDSQPVNWTRPSAALLAPPLLLMFFVMLGARAAFAIPIELRGNWIFQLVGTTKPSECRRVAAAALLLVGCLPALSTTAPVYLVLWCWQDAVAHLGFVLLIALLLALLLTRRWAKIPFTCSFQPGKADLKVKFGLYGVAFIVAVALVLQIELRALASARAYSTVAALVALALIALSRRRDQAGERLVFDDQPVPLVRTLGLGV